MMLISASTYCSPFCRMEMRAAGGTSVPLMLDWLMWLSIPNVNAEWEKPAGTEASRGREAGLHGAARTQGPGRRHGQDTRLLAWARRAGRGTRGPRETHAGMDGNAASSLQLGQRY